MTNSDESSLPAAQQASPRRVPAWLVFLLAGAVSVASVLLVQGPRTWLVYFALTAAVLVSAVCLVVRRRTRLRPLAFAGGWLAAPVLMLGAFLWWTGTLGDYFLARRFDSEVWQAKAGADLGDRTRLRMVDDLLLGGRLDGLNREEVVRLLGEPLRSTHPSDEWMWHVGPAEFIDYRYLRVRFGPDDRVAGYELFNS